MWYAITLLITLDGIRALVCLLPMCRRVVRGMGALLALVRALTTSALNNLSTINLLEAFLKKPFILFLLQVSPFNGTAFPLVEEHPKLWKSTRSFAQVLERDSRGPALTDNVVALNNVAPILCPLHCGLWNTGNIL